MAGFTVSQINRLEKLLSIRATETGRKCSVSQEVMEKLFQNPDEFLEKFERLLTKQLRPYLLFQKDFSERRKELISDNVDLYPEDIDLDRVELPKFFAEDACNQTFFERLEELLENGIYLPLGQRHAEYLKEKTGLLSALGEEDEIIFPGTIWKNRDVEESYWKSNTTEPEEERFLEIPMIIWGIENFDRLPCKKSWHVQTASIFLPRDSGIHGRNKRRSIGVALYRMK